ncbi:UDP-N-acetylmuramyl tripeptide synthase [Clostridium algifaecis]|uniref:Lipid II isoglutaminyl synthase (glutamine-hydrolyzing) subunit MurT n=1 Tax=Clostridium algifaecis TaxID=1472040 RepID=A0ABS4KUL0_9CLOT|nr:Mur ligase family protein [Clostridium algifaecis]MBP2033749.1 UDP-N-acetylmuramyl tripeptide synthase [Clostridium algifaecis]
MLSKILFKGGSNFPGKVALKLDKDILKTVCKNYNIIIITGTNGKTTTTSMVYNMLKDSDKPVITNNTGANMLTGIVSCFVENFSFKKCSKTVYAVIECDEANLTLLADYVTPDIITVTNLFRDQLDRYGEVYTTMDKILNGIKKVPLANLVLNGDEPLLGDLGLPNRTIYYGFKCGLRKSNTVDINADSKFCKKCKHPYKYNFITYSHLGDFYCDNCGYKRPNLDYSIDEIKEKSQDGSLVVIGGNEFYINQPGAYNMYNALCAYSIAKVCDIPESVIHDSLKTQKSSFGRQEIIDVEGREVRIILVKNPAGYNEAINSIKLDKRVFNLAVLLNDNYADGRDVSWIWDVNFESLSSLNIDNVLISGIRLYDMGVRLKVAGLDEKKFILCKDYSKLTDEIKECKQNRVYVLATYTSMIGFRKYLNSKGYIKKLW